MTVIAVPTAHPIDLGAETRAVDAARVPLALAVVARRRPCGTNGGPQPAPLRRGGRGWRGRDRRSTQARTELGDGDGLAERLGAVERAHRLRLRIRARFPTWDDSHFGRFPLGTIPT